MSHPVPQLLEQEVHSDLLRRKNRMILKLQAAKGLIEPDPGLVRELARNAAFAEWALAGHAIADDDPDEAVVHLLGCAWCWADCRERDRAIEAADACVDQAEQSDQLDPDNFREERQKLIAHLDQQVS